jgi:hypothetical protein
MRLTYNGFDFSQVGKLIILGENAEAVPAEAPQQWRRRLRVRLNTHEPNYRDNFGLIEQGRAALRTQGAQLTWTDSSGAVFLDTPVEVFAPGWPENPNSKGTYHQAIELEFLWLENFDNTQAQVLPARVRNNAPGATDVILGCVEGYKYLGEVTQYDPLHSNRQRTEGRIELRGKLRATPTGTVTERRASLLADHAALKAVLRDNKEVVLNFGTEAVDKVCRVRSFSGDVDQARWEIPWSVTLGFTEFPNEAGYAQCEFTVATREDKEQGKVFLTLSGNIAADTEVKARAKLVTVRSSVVSAGYVALRTDVRTEQLDGEDGTAFIKLGFDEEYQKSTGNLLTWELRVSDSEETAAGLVHRTYSGMVQASGADYGTAYATALAQARALGENKLQLKVRSSVGAVDRQRLTTVDANQAIVTLEFSYEYLVKGSRLWIESSSRVVTENLGLSSAAVSGSIVAADTATATANYLLIKGLYVGRVIKNEEVNTSTQQVGNLDLNTGAPAAGTTSLFARLDFSFSVHTSKTITTMQYEIEVSKSLPTNEKVTTVTGTIWASEGSPLDAASVAMAFLDAFLGTMSLGTNRESRRKSARKQAPALLSSGANGSNLDIFEALDFTETYVGTLSGAAAVLESELRERVQASGSRVVVQATAASLDVIQQCGTSSGSREVSGRVVATTEAAARDWIKKQKVIPLAGNMAGQIGGTGVAAGIATPLQVTFGHKFLPMVNGTARAGNYNGDDLTVTSVRVVEAEFSFTEYFEELAISF